MGLGGKLAVYPNPAKNIIYIQLLDIQKISFQLTITDLVGRTVLKQDILLDSGNKTVPVDVSPLRDGIYMLRMSDRENVFTKKLVIKR
jgi:aminopeptidase YwaD